MKRSSFHLKYNIYMRDRIKLYLRDKIKCYIIIYLSKKVLYNNLELLDWIKYSKSNKYYMLETWTQILSYERLEATATAPPPSAGCELYLLAGTAYPFLLYCFVWNFLIRKVEFHTDGWPDVTNSAALTLSQIAKTLGATQLMQDVKTCNFEGSKIKTCNFEHAEINTSISCNCSATVCNVIEL